MKHMKSFLILPLLVLFLAACAKGAMEDQSGGTETGDAGYTEFGAKGVTTKGGHERGSTPEGTMEAAPLLREASLPESTTTWAPWLSVSVGRHTCAIADDHSLWCWGDNSHGEMGNGNCSARGVASPQRTGTETNWNQVTVGGSHTCAIKSDGTLWCWGSNQFGELGLGSSSGYAWCPNPSPLQVSGEGWSYVSAGSLHTCGIRGGELYCWGNNGSHELGVETGPSQIASPMRIGSDNTWVSVSAGGVHTCAMKSDNTLWCWGNNSNEEMGGGEGSYNAPSLMEGGPYLSVDTGYDSTCAIAQENRQIMCGGKMGIIRPFPTLAWDRMFWKQVSTCGPYACAIWTDNTLWCWNEYFAGKIGDDDWRTVDTGAGTACAIKADRTLWCWGRNGSSQVGDATTKDRLVPVPISRPR